MGIPIGLKCNKNELCSLGITFCCAFVGTILTCTQLSRRHAGNNMLKEAQRLIDAASRENQILLRWRSVDVFQAKEIICMKSRKWLAQNENKTEERLVRQKNNILRILAWRIARKWRHINTHVRQETTRHASHMHDPKRNINLQHLYCPGMFCWAMSCEGGEMCLKQHVEVLGLARSWSGAWITTWWDVSHTVSTCHVFFGWNESRNSALVYIGWAERKTHVHAHEHNIWIFCVHIDACA